MERKSKKRTRRGRKKKKVEVDTRVPFEVFFAKKVQEGVLGFWQQKEILTFFQGKGLSRLEDKDKYEKTLKLY